MTFLLFAALLYFLPAIIGHNKRDSTGIFILNLLADGSWRCCGHARRIRACTPC